MQTERSVPEVNALAHRFSRELHRLRLAMVQRGIARGELPKGIDAPLIVDIVSALVQRALLFDEKLDSRYLDRVLNLVLTGASACAPDPANGRSGKLVGKGLSKPRPRAK
jgi:hypothetical protein